MKRKPQSKGPGPGWHKEPMRHRVAAKLGWKNRRAGMKPKHTPAELYRIHQERSKRAREQDEKQTAKRLLEPTDPFTDSWVKDPGQMDIRGLDGGSEITVGRKARDILDAKNREGIRLFIGEEEKDKLEQRGWITDGTPAISQGAALVDVAQLDKLGFEARILEVQVKGGKVAYQIFREPPPIEPPAEEKHVWKFSKNQKIDTDAMDTNYTNKSGGHREWLKTDSIGPAKFPRVQGMSWQDDLRTPDYYPDPSWVYLVIPHEEMKKRRKFKTFFENELKKNRKKILRRELGGDKSYVTYHLGGETQQSFDTDDGAPETVPARLIVSRRMEGELMAHLGDNVQTYPLGINKFVVYKGERGYGILAPRIQDY